MGILDGIFSIPKDREHQCWKDATVVANGTFCNVCDRKIGDKHGNPFDEVPA